ncbi:MAG: UDP-3-O-acyl-N-acetylglucosamine deacetylase [Succinivibrio sp.]
MINQRTIQKPVSLTGIGLHSGAKVQVAFRPAPADTGLIYTRTDLNPQVVMKCTAESVRDTQLCTALVNENGVRISTVEHLTAALSAFGIDNLYIDVSAPEIPVMDGSSQPFIYLFASTGIKELSAPKSFLRVKRKVRVENDGKWAELLPSESGFHLDLQIDFNHPAMEREKQHIEVDFTGNIFASDISRARTFCFMRDVEFMHAHNLALGGSLDNAVVLDENRVINPEGLRYDNEFVKHKLLDAIGDLYMSGHSILGSFRAYKTGHDLNNRLLRAFLSDPANFEIIEFSKQEDSKSDLAIDFLDTKKALAAF